MAETNSRPLSPHLQVWRWGPAMFVSILHRASGDGLAVVGGLMLLWWLYAVSAGPEAYDCFIAWVWAGEEGNTLQFIANILGKVVLVGLSWAFFQHMLSGLRHFVLDIGAGYEIETNTRWSIALPILGLLITGAFWAILLV